MKLASPAKINLFFRVLSKRADGYHEIETLLQAIDLFDTLLIEPHSKDLFSCSDPRLPLDETNLVIRALSLFRKRYSFDMPLRIHLEKRIPMEAGLGGGSGNAATLLWGINLLAGRVATSLELSALGAELGSDVPFFFSTGTAYCSGRGEHVASLAAMRGEGWLAIPPFRLSTRQVYETLRIDALDMQNVWRNDLESAAFSLAPKLSLFKDWLNGFRFDRVAMTGSGSAFFCFGPSRRLDSSFIPFRFAQRSPEGWYTQNDSRIGEKHF
ncbi:MAG: 4-(cytidine 5'-diphospho)-2-C-methyl-D-erythritol kinase [Verrucomicrobiota bacterium]|nr:4-(cytidine 5'-diphospho)-2-C-methyl-D-erythritol kinase [Verrucomicrobiota bacterium]